MAIVLAFLQLGLSVVFGVAGVAKVFDQRGTRAAVVDFGAPASWSGPLALVLPLAEIAVALSLLLAAAAWAGALAALLLLGVFIAAIILNLSRGRAPECHCFGQLYSRPLGWPTLVRNIVIAGGAGFVVWQGRQAVQSSTSLLAEQLGGKEYFPLLAFLALAGVVTAVTWWQRASAKKAALAHKHNAPELSGLALGTAAPVFQLPAYRREQTSLQELLEPGKPVLLIFSNPHCGPCAALFQELAAWQRTYPEQVTIAVLTQGTLKENFVNIARHDLRNILFQSQREIAEQYQCLATPTGVLISADGLIASAPAPGADKIRKLINSTIGKQARAIETADEQIPGSSYLPASAHNAD